MTLSSARLDGQKTHEIPVSTPLVLGFLAHAEMTDFYGILTTGPYTYTISILLTEPSLQILMTRLLDLSQLYIFRICSNSCCQTSFFYNLVWLSMSKVSILSFLFLLCSLYPRLASRSLCSQEKAWTSDSPTSLPRVRGLCAHATKPGALRMLAKHSINRHVSPAPHSYIFSSNTFLHIYVYFLKREKMFFFFFWVRITQTR